jgi:ribosomal protein S12
MKLPSYRIQQAVRKYKLTDPVKGDGGQIVGVTQQANAWGHAEDILQKVSDSSLVHVKFQKQMGPLKVEYLWPSSKCAPSDAVPDLKGAAPLDSRGVPSTYANPDAKKPSNAIRKVELQWQIDECLGRITNTELRAFMRQVVIQPEIVEVLRMQSNAGAVATPRYGINNRELNKAHRSMVQCLQSAARTVCVELSKGWGTPTDVKEVLYAATVLEGCKWGLDRHYRSTRISEFKPCSGDEILFAAVLGALHKLDDTCPEQAHLLRSCMGWACMDEVDAPVDAMRRCIAIAVGRSLKTWGV